MGAINKLYNYFIININNSKKLAKRLRKRIFNILI